MAERPRTKIQRRIQALADKHEAHDPAKPGKEWIETWTDAQLEQRLGVLLDAYEDVAPHLPRQVAIALRNLIRRHPKLRLRGEDTRREDNYITPDGEPFYWGGVRRVNGKVVPGGRGRFPLGLLRYLQTRDGQKREAEGEPTFYLLSSPEGKKIAKAGLRRKTTRDSKLGQDVRKKAGRA